MEVVIREANPSDADAACEVMRRSILEICAPDYEGLDSFVDEWLENKGPENVRDWIEAESCYAVVAKSATDVVGFGMINRDGEILLCYVVPEVLRCGVGKQLLSYMETKAMNWGVSTVTANSTVTACKFYQSQGYVITGKARTAKGIPVEYPMAKDSAMIVSR